MPYVYMLRCSDGTLYVGSTRNLEARMEDHARGKGGDYTSHRRPVTLVWTHETDSVADAWRLKRKLHGWSHPKKQALIDGDWELVSWLSRGSTPRQARGTGTPRQTRGTVAPRQARGPAPWETAGQERNG